MRRCGGTVPRRDGPVRTDPWDYGPLYAAWCRSYREDLDHYAALARDAPRELPILELGCGTGRVLEVLDREDGAPLLGVDSSFSQLKTAAETPGLGAAIRESRLFLACGDMARFRFAGPFGLIVMAYNSFAYLVTEEERVECIRRIRRHLAPGCVFAMDLDNPSFIETLPEGVFGLDDQLADHPQPGFRTRVYIGHRRHDGRPVENVRYRVVTTGPDGFRTTREIRHDMFSASRGEIESLLLGSGFDDVTIRGRFDEPGFDPGVSPLLVVEAR